MAPTDDRGDARAGPAEERRDPVDAPRPPSADSPRPRGVRRGDEPSAWQQVWLVAREARRDHHRALHRVLHVPSAALSAEVGHPLHPDAARWPCAAPRPMTTAPSCPRCRRPTPASSFTAPRVSSRSTSSDTRSRRSRSRASQLVATPDAVRLAAQAGGSRCRGQAAGATWNPTDRPLIPDNGVRRPGKWSRSCTGHDRRRRAHMPSRGEDASVLFQAGHELRPGSAGVAFHQARGTLARWRPRASSGVRG